MSVHTLIPLAFALCTFFSLGVLYVFPKLGLMDRPERYGHNRPAIPYPGGWALVLAVSVTLLAATGFHDLLILKVLACALILTLVSFWDDRRGLSPFLRLAVQLALAMAIFYSDIRVHSLNLPWGEWGFGLEISCALTVIWVMVLVNALNWLDGVPGLTSGVSTVAAGVLLVLSMREGFHAVDQTRSILLSASLLGAALAFFPFEVSPPKMLMGDTGSMFLGFLFAVTALISGGKLATTLLILAIPLLDFAWTILRRLAQKRSPFKGDLWHFHHRFLKAGLTEFQVVLIYILLSIVLGSSALLLQTQGKVWLFLGVLGLMLMITVILYFRIRRFDDIKKSPHPHP